METLGSRPRRRLRDNACQLRAEILRYEEDTKPQRLHGAMVPWSPQRNRSDLGGFVGFPYVMWVPLKMLGL